QDLLARLWHESSEGQRIRPAITLPGAHELSAEEIGCDEPLTQEQGNTTGPRRCDGSTPHGLHQRVPDAGVTDHIAPAGKKADGRKHGLSFDDGLRGKSLVAEPRRVD